MAEDRWIPRTIDEMLEYKPPHYEWLWPDVFARGEALILIGREGMGKTTLMRQMGVLSAVGIHPFYFTPLERELRVLSVDLENPYEIIMDESNVGSLTWLHKRIGRAIPNFKLLHFPEGLHLLEQDDAVYMRKVLDDFRPDLFMLGPLYKAGVDVSNDREATLFVEQLDRWQVLYNFGIILEAHQPQAAIVADSEGKNRFSRPIRPIGGSTWLRWPEFGRCLFDNGTLYQLREDRAVRKWPKRLWRDSGEWPWVAQRSCLQCGKEIPENREAYCSDACGNAFRQVQHRAQGKTVYVVEGTQ